MPVFQTLGDRMKFYERLVGSDLMPLVPAIVRLDGRAFHTFTSSLDRPFDLSFANLMTDVTTALVEETGALIGYTQSDEITLVLHSSDFRSQIYFDGKVHKINSILAGICTSFFQYGMHEHLPKMTACMPVFDCRCFSVPNEGEAVACLVWRERDATRNSIMMLGQSYFSHKELHGRNTSEIQDMLFKEHQVNWNDLPARLKRGTYVQKRRVMRPFSVDEIEQLPPKHDARSNPDLLVERWECRRIEMPIISQVVNLRDVVFRGAEPVVADNEVSIQL